ncbi:unnamed protein product [Parascedosporium putredinis]|uniref:Uncharacterized protein n=1 Tax=Parascedosporium putredinis TaxID=1442378 RepID=A0A9P1H861_9PEZI|nr:unnamed protein product [Parascedosporium putredinis]CAI7999443.1 unnamed protein product [Parascedosporium putredinis]
MPQSQHAQSRDPGREAHLHLQRLAQARVLPQQHGEAGKIRDGGETCQTARGIHRALQANTCAPSRQIYGGSRWVSVFGFDATTARGGSTYHDPARARADADATNVISRHDCTDPSARTTSLRRPGRSACPRPQHNATANAQQAPAQAPLQPAAAAAAARISTTPIPLPSIPSLGRSAAAPAIVAQADLSNEAKVATAPMLPPAPQKQFAAPLHPATSPANGPADSASLAETRVVDVDPASSEQIPSEPHP